MVQRLNIPTFVEDYEDSIASSQSLTPELLWPSIQLSPNGGYTSIDSSTCPTERDIIEERVKTHYHSPMFWKAIEAVREVYILDSYFHPKAMNMLYNSIHCNSDITSIHLLYGAVHIRDEEFKKYKKKLQKECEHRKCNLRIKEHYAPKRFPYVHDRFALTDNELWHFGADVGGGYNGISAASRGWEGQCSEFKKLFFMAFTNTPVR